MEKKYKNYTLCVQNLNCVYVVSESVYLRQLVAVVNIFSLTNAYHYSRQFLVLVDQDTL